MFGGHLNQLETIDKPEKKEDAPAILSSTFRLSTTDTYNRMKGRGAPLPAHPLSPRGSVVMFGGHLKVNLFKKPDTKSVTPISLHVGENSPSLPQRYHLFSINKHFRPTFFRKT